MSNENSLTPSSHTDQQPEESDAVLKVKDPGSTPGESELLERVTETAKRVAVSAVKHEMHSGPMPAPKQLREYDAALPGTARIIRDEFQANGKHIRESERRGLEASIEDSKENRKTAERLVWGSLCLVLILALTEHENAAIAVAVTTVAAVITGFLQRRAPKASAATSEEES